MGFGVPSRRKHFAGRWQNKLNLSTNNTPAGHTWQPGMDQLSGFRDTRSVQGVLVVALFQSGFHLSVSTRQKDFAVEKRKMESYRLKYSAPPGHCSCYSA